MDRNDQRERLRGGQTVADWEREWYRYHHLFADALQVRLTKGKPNHIDVIAHLRTTGHILFAISGAYALAGIKIAQGRLFDAVNLYKETLLFT